jgi:2-oxoglutarate dehydrogenase E2 component (dihydrolipoamide succinyltransferase)
MEIIMPKMGESVNEGTIIKWYKKPGDKVHRDEIIFEISTDKVDTEIPSPGTGVITEIKFNEGDTVEVGTVVALLDSNGEAIPATEESLPEEKLISEETVPEEPVESVPPAAVTSADGGIIEVEMPKMGESVMDGTIIKWYKKVGDKIKLDETLFEISTDKVDTEVPSPVDGTVVEILVAEQETVDVGTIVAKISIGEQVVVPKPSKYAPSSVEKIEPEIETMHDTIGATKIDLSEKTTESDRFYSPLVLNIAQKENVSFDELSRIAGTGVKGRVTKKDILGYINKRKETGAIPASKISPQSQAEPTTIPQGTIEFAPSGEVEKIPMNNIRQKIMEHMVSSRDTSVHVTSLVEVDMTKIDRFIEAKRVEYKQRGVKLTYMAFIADACIKALKAYPLVNSSIEGNSVLQKKFINLGIAVAVEPTGLIVPNIKAADQLNIAGLANAISDIAYRSRNKKLTPDDISGGTFTITNYGIFGTVFGTPIINQPEVAILGVGAVVKKPVVINVDGSDAIAIRSMMALTLAHDHRLIDGMLGSLFLKYVKDVLEGFDPVTM